MLNTRAVWILSERWGEQLRDITFELLACGREIADKLETQVCALVPTFDTPQIIDELAYHGADKIYTLDTPSRNNCTSESYVETIFPFIAEQNPILVLLSGTSTGQDVASRLSAGLEAGLASDCTRLDVDREGLLLLTKPVYRCKAYATLTGTTPAVQIVTVKPGFIKAKPPNRTRKAEIFTVSCKLSEPRWKVVDHIPANPKTIPIEEADIIVAGGRGVGSRENFQILEELAEVLGGSIAASRMAVDAGWVSSERLVGISGKTVSPKLYIACGISGAVNHAMGMKYSDDVIAINTDRNAPIFRMATVGIVGDLFKVLPPIIKEIRHALNNAHAGGTKVAEVLNRFQ
jgi:electron transfer flavoprotein alpha subunit